ncbi:zinc protease [Aliiroseovarius halocynthiae]|uniref:Insulinase family protein n=1 Tax=Aliiroseovarius halocynthiae TaxID=985055 RepID=A0A545SP69_9RHOB|nr:pitrilysin family protein [Aliiroseovarius halocynthiae]TQV66775.1 insulinase family protein [Aliiroseovarius halocynthiae]SMR82398.1 zinc protease [Aliiroseovarius halocynthiae]
MKRIALVLAGLIALTLPARADVSIEEVSSDNGHVAWLVHEPALPFTALEIRFRGGTVLDRPGKRGAVNLMVGLLEEGAGDMDAQGFAQAREALAASFGFDAGEDSLGISAQFLSENRDQAVDLLHQALTAPRFEDTALERVRTQVLSHLSSRATDPKSLAGDAFDAAAYGDHPYGTYDGGTVDSVTALTREDIVAAYHDTLVLDGIYVAAVGDITADQLGALMDQLFEGLPKTGAALPDHAEFGLLGGTTVVPFDTPQSVAIFGHSGIKREDPDFFAAYLVNTIMGGPSSLSRLMKEVRNKRGLTYGIGSYLVPADWAESVIGQFSSQNAVIGEAMEVVRDEWAKIARDGITQKELTAAQTYLTGSYPLRFDGNGNIANIMVGMQLEGLPIDYIATRNDQVMAVTLEHANRVASELYDPDALHFIVVGQPEGVVSN